MTRAVDRHARIVAIDPTSRGFGFAVLEAPNRLVDWGLRDERRGPRSVLAKVFDLVRRYDPDLLVVENCRSPGSLRRRAARTLIQEILSEAAKQALRTRGIDRTYLRRAFADNQARPINKEGIAAAIASEFPELASTLPPQRKPWMSEDERMAIFDAVAMAVFASNSRSWTGRSATQDRLRLS